MGTGATLICTAIDVWFACVNLYVLFIIINVDDVKFDGRSALRRHYLWSYSRKRYGVIFSVSPLGLRTVYGCPSPCTNTVQCTHKGTVNYCNLSKMRIVIKYDFLRYYVSTYLRTYL